MRYISDEKFIHAFTPNLKPIVTVDEGEKITVRTVDCYCNVLKQNDDPWLELRNTVPGPNPATGPIEVRGASVGDTLAVDILDIRPIEYGIMNVRPGVGAMGDFVEGNCTRRFNVKGGKIDFFGREIDAVPMIGVIGASTAPEDGEIDTETPHKHGGNMDDRHITAGSTVYLPVRQAGGMLALGDVHALMGDGEVGICGLECAAEVDLRCRVIHGISEQWPIVRDVNGCYRVNCSAEDLDAAAYLARAELLKFLKRRIKTLDNDQLIMLMSLAGDLEIAQIVDPLVTCRMGIRPGYLPELEF